MISHSIIVHKEPVVPLGTVYNSVKKEADYNSQAEYEAWLKKQDFHVGNYVTLVPKHVKLTSLMQANCITQIGALFSKLEWSAFGREHKPYRVLSCNLTNNNSPWVRWDSMSGYRHLTTEEYDTYVKPEYDKLQAHCSKHG